ncbi:MAG: hypothetical protein JOZ47_10870 [Kutzneria sp.]|nr:hypothetical protein [Kutzneria sp.]MBV9845562.1 hypothetical protein [Kutzneria sp.]
MRSSAAALPLPDYDTIPFEELDGRIQCLISHELHQLLGYEWVHERRPEFMALLNERLRELASGVSPSRTPVVFIPRQAESPENDTGPAAPAVGVSRRTDSRPAR